MKDNRCKVLTLAACRGNIAAAQAPAEKVRVVISIGVGTGTDPGQVEAQNAFAEKNDPTHDNIEIEFLIGPHDDDATRHLAAFSGGTAPQPVGPNGVSAGAGFFDTWEDVTPDINADNYEMREFYGPAVGLNQCLIIPR